MEPERTAVPLIEAARLPGIPGHSLACIGLGSNLGDSLVIVRDAWRMLAMHGAIRLLALSPLYRSEPLGMRSNRPFVNAAGCLATTLSPIELLAALHGVEAHFGRRREPGRTGYQDRTLDLDLLLYEAVVCRTPSLILPHPAMHERLFVLEPLAHIAPDYIHEVAGRTIRELLQICLASTTQSRPVQLSWADCSS